MVATRIARLLLTCAALALAALALTAGAEAKDGGNSASAKQCQKGGWQDLMGSDGTTFASEEECVAFAAEGGTLAPKPTLQQQWEAECVAGGGQVTTIDPTVQWACKGPVSQATKDALSPICMQAGGRPTSRFVAPDYVFVSCDFIF